ncbi:MAG: iron-containing alcohol dehydrogenase [Candidatus Aenigmarchaeota archaeon]|nr:iron-containing alcohol dehydrogenase [Candidatus Aenigmarchaeota archaeon]
MMLFPHVIEISEGACARAGSLIERLRLGRKCALFCTEEIMKIAGEKVLDSMSHYRIDVFTPNSLEAEALRALGERLHRYDFAVAVGGGKTIDIAKYSAYLAGKPWIAVPTIPSHDGVVSSRASLSDNGKRISVTAVEPSAIIADLDVISKAPYRYIAAGAGDALSKLSAVEDWRIADADGKDRMHVIMANLALLAANATVRHAEQIRKKEMRGLEVLLWALTCSGFAMNLAGSSRPGSGSEHNFSHALDELGSKALHGEQVALGTIIMQYLHGTDWKRTKQIMKQLQLPTSLGKIGIDEKTSIKALVMAKNVRDRYTILNKVKIDEKNAKEILRNVGVL